MTKPMRLDKVIVELLKDNPLTIDEIIQRGSEVYGLLQKNTVRTTLYVHKDLFSKDDDKKWHLIKKEDELSKNEES